MNWINILFNIIIDFFICFAGALLTMGLIWCVFLLMGVGFAFTTQKYVPMLKIIFWGVFILLLMKSLENNL